MFFNYSENLIYLFSHFLHGFLTQHASSGIVSFGIIEIQLNYR